MPGMPRFVHALVFGDLAAAWAVLDDLGVPGIVDAAAGGSGDMPAGACLTAAAAAHLLGMHQAYVSGARDLGLGAWWETTAGPRFTGITGEALDAGFRAAVQDLDPARAEAAAIAVTERAAAEHGRTVRRYETGAARSDAEIAVAPFLLPGPGSQVPRAAGGLISQTAAHAARLLRLRTRQVPGLPRTTDRILRELERIREAELVYDDGRTCRMLSETNARQTSLVTALGLTRYAPQL